MTDISLAYDDMPAHPTEDLDDISALAAELQKTEGLCKDAAIIRALELYDELAEYKEYWDTYAASSGHPTGHSSCPSRGSADQT